MALLFMAINHSSQTIDDAPFQIPCGYDQYWPTSKWIVPFTLLSARRKLSLVVIILSSYIYIVLMLMIWMDMSNPNDCYDDMEEETDFNLSPRTKSVKSYYLQLKSVSQIPGKQCMWIAKIHMHCLLGSIPNPLIAQKLCGCPARDFHKVTPDNSK